MSDPASDDGHRASSDALNAFAAALARLPSGYWEATFRGRRYGATLRRAADRRRDWLYAEELGGTDAISFNLYHLAGGKLALRPCEMPAEKVIDFVMEVEP